MRLNNGKRTTNNVRRNKRPRDAPAPAAAPPGRAVRDVEDPLEDPRYPPRARPRVSGSGPPGRRRRAPHGTARPPPAPLGPGVPTFTTRRFTTRRHGRM